MAFNKIHWAMIQEKKFEELSQILLNRKDPEIKPIEGSGGDGGIDSFVKVKDNKIDIYQVKFFPNGLNFSQKNQIKSSLETAIENHNPNNWFLVIPQDRTPSMKEWFEKLGESYPETKIEWFGHTELVSELYKHEDLLQRFFKIGPMKFSNISLKKPHIMQMILNKLKALNQISIIKDDEINNHLSYIDCWEFESNFYYLLISEGLFSQQTILNLSKNLRKNEIFAIYGSKHELEIFEGKFRLLSLSDDLNEIQLTKIILNQS